MEKIQRKQFTFYKSFYDCCKEIPKATDREKFMMAVAEYALFGKEPEKLPKSCSAAFSIVKPILDNSRKKAENGSKGGSVSGKQTEANVSKPQANASKPKQTEANRKQEKEQEKEQGKDKEQVKEQLEQTEAPGFMGALRELWLAYPVNRRDSLPALYKAAAELSLTETDIMTASSNLKLWKKTVDWNRDNGQYVPGLIKWLQDGRWVSPPPPAQLTSNPFLAIAMEDGYYDENGNW